MNKRTLFRLKNEENSNSTTWMNLEHVMQNEINPSQKDKYYTIPLM